MAHVPPSGPRSALLDALPWLAYAFQPSGLPAPDNTAYGQQRHSATVVKASANWPPKSCVADGIIAESQLAAAVYTADCLPVLFADSEQRQVAAVHAGLQGTLAGVLHSAVDSLLAQGARSETLYVAIGPAIGACCYELGEDRIAQMQQRDDLPPLPWSRQQPTNPHAVRAQAQAHHQGVWFDLPQLARGLLQQRGIPAAQIEWVNVCTYCMAETGSSYRYNTHANSGYASRFSWIRTLP
ncbi:polyphenol oxidase family protein [Pantoea eucrina]|uniref:Polyphenol oxidase family protein n=1 Tax=Pantoea eucrina TaxID=472693 RepID=A0ABU5LB91_9GAMM|nr:polyphenol oxidase family protein [Pantoea eucrina]MDZ7277212.1 polyphenol oxidase family protein [Pantoea eucrina]